MMLDPRDHGAGVDGLEDPILGPLADAHDPAEEEVPVGLETRFGEGDGQGLQEGVERWDDRPHGGRLLVAWGVSKTRLQPQVYRGSPPVSLPRNLRKFSSTPPNERSSPRGRGSASSIGDEPPLWTYSDHRRLSKNSPSKFLSPCHQMACGFQA